MKPFTAVAMAIFAAIAAIHLLRLFAGWEVIVIGFVVPVWWSAPVCIVAGVLTLMLWCEARDRGKVTSH
jgi:hypothetical protein